MDENITFQEFKGWLMGLIVKNEGRIPDLEDWKQIKAMMDRVDDGAPFVQFRLDDLPKSVSLEPSALPPMMEIDQFEMVIAEPEVDLYYNGTMLLSTNEDGKIIMNNDETTSWASYTPQDTWIVEDINNG